MTARPCARSCVQRRIRPRAVPRRTSGFTLLELVVSLAIAAIIALLATSGYESTLLRSRRLDARAALLMVAAAQERHRLQHGRYAVLFDPSAAGEDAAALPLAALSPEGHYALQLATDADALEFTVTARTRAAQQRDRACARLTLDHVGHRNAHDASGGDTTAACWR